MKRQLIGFILCFIGIYTLSAQSPYIHNVVATLQDAEQRHGGRIAFSLTRLSDHKNLVEYRSRELFTPASVVKVLSSGALLRERGRRYRYPTEIYAVGTIVQDSLKGGLLIRGSGDPSLATDLIEGERYRFNNEVLQALKERGIRHITGGLYFDASLPTGVGPIESWAKEDLIHAYGAGLFGLNYADNKVGSKAESNPAQSLASALESRLRFAGITIRKASSVSYEGYEPEGLLLYTYYSRPLERLASVTNHRSMNMYAEALAQALNPNLDRGIVLSNYWRRLLSLGAEDIQLVDGSGLSRENKLSARALERALVLLYGGHAPEDGILVETLPRLGAEGTIRGLMPNTTIQAYLKSGTMRRVCTYVGYVYYGKEWYALVYLTNEFPQASQARGIFSSILNDLFSQSEYQ